MNTANYILKFITVPYLPLIGLTSLESIDEALIEDILGYKLNDKILIYDKDRRWFSEKNEYVVKEPVKILKNSILLVVSDRSSKTIKLYCYGDIKTQELLKIVQELRIKFCVKDIIVINFNPLCIGENLSETEVFLWRSSASKNTMSKSTQILSKTDWQKLEDLATDDSTTGFGYLATQYERQDVGDVLATISNGKITGAIGPIDVRMDNRGRKFLLPMYFGVLPEYRRRGEGKKLWEAALSIATDLGANYHIFQAEPEAARFYSKLGMESFGHIYRTKITG